MSNNVNRGAKIYMNVLVFLIEAQKFKLINLMWKTKLKFIQFLSLYCSTVCMTYYYIYLLYLDKI